MITKNFTRLFVTLCILASILINPTQASAEPSGLFITEGVLAYMLNFNNSPTTSVKEKTFATSETGLGYVFGGWAYIGGVFNYTMLNEKTADNSGNEVLHQATFQYYGPGFGWMGEEWSLIGYYFAVAEYRDAVSGNNGFNGYTTSRSGTGYGVNLGYRFPLWGILIAPVLAMKSIDYKNCKDPVTGSTSTCNPTISQFDVTPQLTFMFNFQ